MLVQQIIKAIVSGRKMIIAFVLIAVCISLAISASMVPIYQSKVTFVIAPNKNLPSSRDVVSAFTALDTLDIFSTYADILSSVRVIEEANKVVGLDDEEMVSYKRSTQMNPQSIILELSVEGPDAKKTAFLANEIGKYGIQFINAYFSVFEIDFLDQAVISKSAYKPRTYRDMGIFAGFGLCIGLIVVIFKELLDIPINQFVQRFSMDNESLALNKVSMLRALGNMKTKDNEWPITFIMMKLINFMEIYDVLPKFSRKEIATEIVKRLKRQVKGADLTGRWDDSVFVIVLPKTPAKVSSIVINKIKKEFTSPIYYGIEDSDKLTVEPVFSTSTSKNVDEFGSLISDAESALRIMK